jgi:adenine phosphoribosyltransferase
MDLTKYIRDVPDFPKKGIIFKDITTLLKDKDAFHYTIQLLAEHFRPRKIDTILGIESRGFIFGAALAYELGSGLVLVRKPGKLPAATQKVEYQLEYGNDSLEIHKDALQAGQHVLIIDDLLATGGTAAAVAQLVEALDARVEGLGFIIELTFLHGREKLKNYDVFTLIQYET